MFIRLIAIAIILSSPSLAFSQIDTDFGKVSDEERQILPPPEDSSAEAYVLYDHLDLHFIYDDDKGPQLVEEFHRRLKLLTAASFDRADVTLRYDRRYQEVGQIKAVVHLADGGAIKLKKSDIIQESEDKFRRIIKFTFPQVSEGAIIEYTWTKQTDGIVLPTPYVFQESVPVRKAEYTATIPPYYSYISLGAQGQYSESEVKTVNQPWGPSFTPNQPYDHQERLPMTSIHWAMEDIPAYERQPYTNNFQDYIPKVRLQLQSVQYPGQPISNVFNSWQETVDELYDRKDFGRSFLGKANYGKLWREVEDRIEAAPTEKEKIDAAYYFICDRLTWNGNFGFFANETPNQLLQEGTEGNGAALNLSLVALLNEAGIEAYPLLVSLRDGGAPIEIYPLLRQFDHVLVYTEVDGKPYVLDANGPSRPPGLPRLRALNHRAWVADRKNPRWVDLEVPPAQQVVMATIELDQEGMADVALSSRLGSYFAFSGRIDLEEMEKDNEVPVGSEIRESFPEAEVTEFAVAGGQDSSSEPLTLDINMRVPAGAANQDYLYVQPVLLPFLDRELVDADVRLYPIDFAYPYRKQYIATVRLPEGYVVEELPESIRMVSQDGGLKTSYASQTLPDGSVQINFSVFLERTVYPPDAYPALREMYRKIIELQESAIVLKRAK